MLHRICIMKKIYIVSVVLVLLSFLLCAQHTGAQSRHRIDSLTYETQREKVNNLLNERSRRFGEYDQSLHQKTGIFGIFKSKSDMQRSIDILKDIVITDNNIFIETKKLLDLKDYEKEHYQKLAVEYDEQALAYMKTITKLQQENDKLRQEIAKLEDTEHGNDVLLYVALLIILGLSFFVLMTLYNRYRTKKIDETLIG